MKVYKDDIGTKIKLDAGCNIATATVWKILYSKPGKTRVEGGWVAIPEETNYIYYITRNELYILYHDSRRFERCRKMAYSIIYRIAKLEGIWRNS